MLAFWGNFYRRRLQEGTFILQAKVQSIEAMTDLIARLEAAPAGSRELDGHIALAAGWLVEFTETKESNVHWGFWKWTEPGLYGLSVDTEYHGQEFEVAPHVPHFSTSIDAKLPWEDIVTVMKIPGGFVAEHVENHQCFSGEAHTEPLARRIAALKAREHDRPDSPFRSRPRGLTRPERRSAAGGWVCHSW